MNGAFLKWPMKYQPNTNLAGAGGQKIQKERNQQMKFSAVDHNILFLHNRLGQLIHNWIHSLKFLITISFLFLLYVNYLGYINICDVFVS